MRFLARALAVVCGGLFILTASGGLVLFNLGTLLRAEVYQRALAEQNLYERLPALVAGQLTSSIAFNPCAQDPLPPQCEGEGTEPPEEGEGQGGPPPYFDNLTRDDWEAIFIALLPPDWLHTTADSFLDQLFTALNTTEGPAIITLSLGELKQRIGGDAGVAAVVRVINAQPPCTAGEMPTPGEEFTDMPTCRPPEALLESLKPEIRKQLQTLAAQLSDERTLTLFAQTAESEPPPPDEGPANGPPDPRTAFRIIRIVSLLSPLPALAFLGLIALFAVRGWRDLLAWWGVPLALVGLFVFTLAMSVPPLMEWATAFVMGQSPAGLTPALVRTAYDLVRSVAGAVTTRMAIEAGALGLIGLLMFAGSWRQTKSGIGSSATN